MIVRLKRDTRAGVRRRFARSCASAPLRQITLRRHRPPQGPDRRLFRMSLPDVYPSDTGKCLREVSIMDDAQTSSSDQSNSDAARPHEGRLFAEINDSYYGGGQAEATHDPLATAILGPAHRPLSAWQRIRAKRLRDRAACGPAPASDFSRRRRARSRSRAGIGVQHNGVCSSHAAYTPASSCRVQFGLPDRKCLW